MWHTGTLHIIFLIALADLKTTVRTMRISEINDVARILRDPLSTCYFCWLIMQSNGWSPVDTSLSVNVMTIISTIASLHEHVEFKLHTLLDEGRCCNLGIQQVISSKGVVDSDIFFDDIQFM